MNFTKKLYYFLKDISKYIRNRKTNILDGFLFKILYTMLNATQ